MASIRIGAGQGFYGDTPDGAVEVARNGGVSYICCDALAELTMAILVKDRLRDPQLGYARDLPDFARQLLPIARDQGIRIITNAGGINPQGGVAAVAAVATELGMHDLRIAVVEGDDLTTRMTALREAGEDFRHLDTGADIGGIVGRLVFAVAYLGITPLLTALREDADIVITGRVADASLFAAPLIHELGWELDDWDRLAAGVVIGHLMECSGQATGGNFSGDWANVAELDRVGYPVAEVFDDGTAHLSKPPGTGGRVAVDTVKEQLLYEVLDPRAYANPDVVADFTTVSLDDVAPDVVRISGARGTTRPDRLKVIAGYLDGWAGTATIGYSWPQALAKAERSAELIQAMAARAGLQPLEQVVEYIGVNSVHGDAAPVGADVNEVVLRVCSRFATEADARRFSRVATPLALNGPPFIGGGMLPQSPRALLGVWPTLVDRGSVEPHVQVTVRTAREISGATR